MGGRPKPTPAPRTPRTAAGSTTAGARPPKAATAQTAGRGAAAGPGSALKDAVLPELRRLLATEELETLLPMAEALLVASPDAEVRTLVKTCRAKLVASYGSRLGRLSTVPRRKLEGTLDLDERAAFVLELVDDVSSFERIIDSSGIPRHEVMRVLDQLLARGIIAP